MLVLGLFLPCLWELLAGVFLRVVLLDDLKLSEVATTALAVNTIGAWQCETLDFCEKSQEYWDNMKHFRAWCLPKHVIYTQPKWVHFSFLIGKDAHVLANTFSDTHSLLWYERSASPVPGARPTLKLHWVSHCNYWCAGRSRKLGNSLVLWTRESGRYCDY